MARDIAILFLGKDYTQALYFITQFLEFFKPKNNCIDVIKIRVTDGHYWRKLKYLNTTFCTYHIIFNKMGMLDNKLIFNLFPFAEFVLASSVLVYPKINEIVETRVLIKDKFAGSFNLLNMTKVGIC